MAKIHKPSKNKLEGNRVIVGDLPFDVAFRRFRKKVEASGLLKDLRDKEHYEKPTTVKKAKRNAARKRWQRELARNQLPKKLY